MTKKEREQRYVDFTELEHDLRTIDSAFAVLSDLLAQFHAKVMQYRRDAAEGLD